MAAESVRGSRIATSRQPSVWEAQAGLTVEPSNRTKKYTMDRINTKCKWKLTDKNSMLDELSSVVRGKEYMPFEVRDGRSENQTGDCRGCTYPGGIAADWSRFGGGKHLVGRQLKGRRFIS